MNKIIYNKFDKHKIPELPRVVFPGRIITLITAGEAERAVDYLLTSDILGFDTETRPIFKKGRRNKVALLQVSNHDTCFLFRLNRMGLCPAVIRLMETVGPLKIGLSWHDDLMSLHQRGDFEARGFIDLQDHMKELGIMDMSLAKLYANLFHQRISKREQLSNWEADVLSQKQKDYAATDAWACVMLYEEFLRLKETQDFFLEVVPEPEPAEPVKPLEIEEVIDSSVDKPEGEERSIDIKSSKVVKKEEEKRKSKSATPRTKSSSRSRTTSTRTAARKKTASKNQSNKTTEE